MPISEKAGARHVDPHLITAITAIESGGNPNAVSPRDWPDAVKGVDLRARRLPSRAGGGTDHQRAENPERNILNKARRTEHSGNSCRSASKIRR